MDRNVMAYPLTHVMRTRRSGILASVHLVLYYYLPWRNEVVHNFLGVGTESFNRRGYPQTRLSKYPLMVWNRPLV